MDSIVVDGQTWEYETTDYGDGDIEITIPALGKRPWTVVDGATEWDAKAAPILAAIRGEDQARQPDPDRVWEGQTVPMQQYTGRREYGAAINSSEKPLPGERVRTETKTGDEVTATIDEIVDDSPAEWPDGTVIVSTSDPEFKRTRRNRRVYRRNR